MAAADVAGECQREFMALLFQREHHGCGAEHVAGVVGAVGEARGDLARLTLGGGLKQRQGVLGVFNRIERRNDCGVSRRRASSGVGFVWP